MRIPVNRAVRAGAFAAVVGAVALASGAQARASEDATPLVFRVADPPPVSFDATALGRATHPLRMVVANTSARTVQLEPLTVHFRPTREGVQYTCDDARGEEPRWPATLDAGASFLVSRSVSCATPLPGRYEVDVRGRPRGAPDTAERTLTSFTIVMTPGPNAPVRLPWAVSLHAAASGTHDMRPTTDPDKARIVVAMINGTSRPVTLAPVRATMRVKRRGSTAAPCAERTVELPFNGPLGSGRMLSLTTPLGCELRQDGLYDVEITVGNPAGDRIRVATHTIRTGVIPPPGPRAEEGDSDNTKSFGGM